MTKKNKIATMTGIALLSVGLLAGCTTSNTQGGPTNTASIQKATKYVSTNVSFLVGKDGAIPEDSNIKDKVVIDIYLDPLCVGCFSFENATGEYLNKELSTGKVVVRYHPLMFLDANSTDQYSSRASAYLIGVADASPKLANKFLAALFSEKFYPTEENYRPTSNEDLDKLFKSIGGTDEEVKVINSKLKKNMNSVYEKTMAVVKDKELAKKSPTGTMFTPFVIPNSPGKTDANAISIQGDMNSELKNAVEKALK